MNEVDEQGGEGGVALSDASISILAGGGLEKEEKPLVNDENKEEDKEAKQGEYDFLEDKFRVLNPDNTVNLEMSAEKMANSYKSLASRLGTGDVPPKSADEYNIKIESETLNFDDFKKDPENQGFLSKALECGMTSKQVEFVLNEYARVMPAAFDRFKGLTQEQAQSELTETWKSEAEFKSNIKDAFSAFNKYASPEDKGKIDEIGNNPIIIRLLANMGKNLREDAPPAKNTGLEPDDVQKIMKTDAYRDPKHPDHKEAHKKVREYYQGKYGNEPIY